MNYIILQRYRKDKLSSWEPWKQVGGSMPTSASAKSAAELLADCSNRDGWEYQYVTIPNPEEVSIPQQVTHPWGETDNNGLSTCGLCWAAVKIMDRDNHEKWHANKFSMRWQ